MSSVRDIKIKSARGSDKQAWDNYVLNHPDGIAYQLWAWKQAVEKAYGFKTIYLMASEKSKTVGIMPLVFLKPPVLPGSLVSLPYCDAGGILSNTPDIRNRLIHEAFVTAKKLGAKFLTVRSLQDFSTPDYETAAHPEKVRMVLKLPPSSDALLASLKAKVRSQAKKPIRDGLTAVLGGIELVDDFYSIFSENMRDLGSPVHTKKWIISILKAFGNHAHIGVVKIPDGSIAASGIILCCGKTVSIPWASSLRKYNRYNPNMLLYWTFLKFACDMKYSCFDFGRSSVGEGTYRFKKQWGAEPAPLFWEDYRIGPAGTADISGKSQIPVDRDLLAAILSKIPVSMNRAIGMVSRKYISL